MKNWMVAVLALAMGGAVTVSLLVFANPARGQVDVFAAAHDIPAGALIVSDVLRSERVAVSSGTSSLFTGREESQLVGRRAGHDLAAGQLVQRTDVLAATSSADERLVFLPVKDAPPAAPGARLDLLVVGGTADRPTVLPFALGVEVRDVVTGGFVVAVPSRQAAAFVYAAEVMRLVAVVAQPDASAGAEGPVDAPDQALAVASQP